MNGTWVFVVAVGLLGFLLWRALFRRKAASREKPAVYVCDRCGEMHCECHLEPPDEKP